VVPGVIVDANTIYLNGDIVTLTLSWRKPFNNLDPIVNYSVSCSGDGTCPPNFTATDNTTRSYTITNLMPGTNYTFLVVATNSIGSGEAGIVMITTPCLCIIITTTVTITSTGDTVPTTATSINTITTTAAASTAITTTSTTATTTIAIPTTTTSTTNASGS